MTFIIGAGEHDIFAHRDAQGWPGSVVATEARSFDPAPAAGRFTPAGERYRALNEPEREALIAELALALSTCDGETQARMIRGFTAVDVDYGRRVFEALTTRGGKSAAQ